MEVGEDPQNQSGREILEAIVSRIVHGVSISKPSNASELKHDLSAWPFLLTVSQLVFGKLQITKFAKISIYQPFQVLLQAGHGTVPKGTYVSFRPDEHR